MEKTRRGRYVFYLFIDAIDRPFSNPLLFDRY